MLIFDIFAILFFRSFNWALSCGGAVPLFEGLENSELPGIISLSISVHLLFLVMIMFIDYLEGEIKNNGMHPRAGLSQ